MNKKATVSTTHFNLAIDQGRDRFLNHLTQLAMGNPDYADRMNRNGLKEISEEFYKDMARGTDKVEWCNTKDCEGGRCEHKEDVEAVLKSKNGYTSISRILDKTDKTYSLEFDEDRDTIFNVMDTAAQKNPFFLEYIVDHKLGASYKKLLREWSDKAHEAGFCKDPNCTYDKKDNL